MLVTYQASEHCMTAVPDLVISAGERERKKTKQNKTKCCKTPADFSSTARVRRLFLSELGHP
jgi:hypothetical protein